MEPAFIVVVILFGILLIHHVRIKQQLRNLKKQLKYRQTEQTKSPLYLELGDKDLYALVAIMNQALDADKVFQRFYVGDPSRNQSTGLGLSIVKLLVEKMQGEVFARNEGGVFCIGFLLLKEEDAG